MSNTPPCRKRPAVILHLAAGGGCRPSSETAAEKGREPALGAPPFPPAAAPLRTAYRICSTGFETDGLPKARFVPSSAPSPPRLSRAAWTARRFRYAGALLSGPHTGHLRPRRHGGPEGDGHGKNFGGCPLILPEIPDGPDTEVPRSGPAFGQNGSESGRSEIPQIRSELSIPAKAEESRLILREIRRLCDCGCRT